jgi:low affinity Fe/Cu permease
MEKKKIKRFLVLTVFLAFIIIFSLQQILAFEVDSVLTKSSIKQQDSISKTIKITNTQSEKQNFKIKSDFNFLSIREKDFSLEAGETKSIELVFTTKYNKEETEPGVYLGNLLISNNLQTTEVPIILEIETKEVLFDINLDVLPEYSSLYPGEKTMIETKVFNLENIGLKTTEMIYFIKDFQGNIIFSEQENLAIETQILNTKKILIPQNIQTGNYVFIAIVKYSDSIGTSSYFFRVTKKPFSAYIEENLIYIITTFIVILFIMIMLIFYSIKQKDKIIAQLEKQYRKDLRKKSKAIEKRKNITVSKLKTKKEKTVIEKGFEAIKKQKIKAIKKMQKTRIQKLKKYKKRSHIQKQITKWKQQGYNTSILEPKKTTNKHIEKQIKTWKKKGYNTKVLEEELNRKV